MTPIQNAIDMVKERLTILFNRQRHERVKAGPEANCWEPAVKVAVMEESPGFKKLTPLHSARNRLFHKAAQPPSLIPSVSLRPSPTATLLLFFWMKRNTAKRQKGAVVAEEKHKSLCKETLSALGSTPFRPGPWGRDAGTEREKKTRGMV